MTFIALLSELLHLLFSVLIAARFSWFFFIKVIVLILINFSNKHLLSKFSLNILDGRFVKFLLVPDNNVE